MTEELFNKSKKEHLGKIHLLKYIKLCSLGKRVDKLCILVFIDF